MAEAATYTFKQRGLVQQGYVGYSPEDLAKLTWGLRFTPSVIMAGALVGLATQTAWIHFVLAALGIIALALPAHHPFDLLYNHGVRRLTSGPKLPPNPLPRRIARALAGGMNLGIGLCFQSGLLLPAYVLGGLLIVLQISVISLSFCVACWLLERGAALLGYRQRISGEEAHRLVAEDNALLLDVRTPEEFVMEHLPGALNIPVGEVPGRTDELRGKGRPLVVYCTAGVRSHKAAKILERAGVDGVHELGSMKRW